MVAAVRAAYAAARKAQESLYSGVMTVTERRKIRNEETKLTAETDVTVLEDQPCKLSFETLKSTVQTETAAAVTQVIRLFLAPDVTVRPGSKITVTQDGVSVSDVLTRIVSKCNSHAVDLDVSIHFNAGAGDTAGNGQTTGVEVYTYDSAGIARDSAERVCTAVSALGFKNRGAKINRNLYVLRNTGAPAMLIECCFVDDRDDVQLYDCQKMADAIVYGITGQASAPVEDPAPADQDAAAPGVETPVGDKKQLCRVQVGAYAVEANAVAMQARLKAAGFDAIIVKA